jgi:hypothetical protein
MIALAASAAVLLVLQIGTPFWWWVVAVPFVYGLVFVKKNGRAFGGGMLIGAIVWGGAGLYFYIASGRLIAGRMAGMFRIGPGWLMIFATALLGALVAGLAAFAGRSLRPPGARASSSVPLFKKRFGGKKIRTKRR